MAKIEKSEAFQKPMFFFVTGLPKSGTTWMMNMLNCLNGVCCLGEGRFFASELINVPSLMEGMAAGVRPWYEFIACRKNNWIGLDKAIQTINCQNFLPKDTLGETFDEDIRQLTYYAARHFMKKILHRFPEIKLIGDKTPLICINDLNNMFKTFPDTKILFFQREAKDFVVSLLFHFWRSMRDNRPDRHISFLTIDDFLVLEEYINAQDKTSAVFVRKSTAIELAKIWKNLNREASRLSLQSPNRMKIVSYEKLFEHPLIVLEDAVYFLGVNTNREQLTKIVNKNSRATIDHGNDNVLKIHLRSKKIGDWVQYLNNDISSAIDEASR